MIRISYMIKKIVKTKTKSTSVLKKKLTICVKSSHAFNKIEGIKTLKKMNKNVEKKNVDLNKKICTNLCTNQLIWKIINLLRVAVAFRKIRKYQKNIESLISETPFFRLMKKIVQNFKSELRFKKNIIEALQKASKCIFVNFFERK